MVHGAQTRVTENYMFSRYLSTGGPFRHHEVLPLENPNPNLHSEKLYRRLNQHCYRRWVTEPICLRCSYLALRDVARKVGDRVSDIVVRHGEDGQLGDGTVAPVHTSCPLVDGGQIGIHVPWVTTATGHFLTGSRHLKLYRAERAGD